MDDLILSRTDKFLVAIADGVVKVLLTQGGFSRDEADNLYRARQEFVRSAADETRKSKL